jgi:hypothetical protein
MKVRRVGWPPIWPMGGARPHEPAPGGLGAGRLSSCLPIGGSAQSPGAAWPDYPLGRRRVGCEQAGRADGALDELATAIRADAVQDVLRAVAAPGALVCADEHVRGCRVEVPVAAFAIGSQLQHMTSFGRQRRLKQAFAPILTAVATSRPAKVRGHRAG